MYNESQWSPKTKWDRIDFHCINQTVLRNIFHFIANIFINIFLLSSTEERVIQFWKRQEGEEMMTKLSLSDIDSLEVQCSDAKDKRYHEVHCMLSRHS